MALINKLSAIGDAIREKTGKEDLLTLDQMPEEIKGISGGGEDLEPIVVTGNCQYAFSGPYAIECLQKTKNKITVNGITDASYMFYGYTLEQIPFDLNFATGNVNISLSNMFKDAYNLKELPKITPIRFIQMNAMFQNCYVLREIPDEFFDNLVWDYHQSTTNAYGASTAMMFYNCRSLRKLPSSIKQFKNINQYQTYSNTLYYSGFSDCFTLDEIKELPISQYINMSPTGNMFNTTISSCYRLKSFTLETNSDGTPLIAKWKSQVIDASSYTGHPSGAAYRNYIANENSGITLDKEVKDDATYQALKNDPDWFTCTENYSRYNHDSAVETINSLPDTSAYLATVGGTNSIKFKGNAGSLTDGGAINTLTAEEIAVATAKGWTVSFS